MEEPDAFLVCSKGQSSWLSLSHVKCDNSEPEKASPAQNQFKLLKCPVRRYHGFAAYGVHGYPLLLDLGENHQVNSCKSANVDCLAVFC